MSTFTSFRKVSVTIRYIGGFCMFPYRKILELHSEGVSLRSIATITQHSRQKVTEVIKLAEKMLTSSRNRHFLPISFLQILLDKIRHLFLIKNSLPMFHSITFIVHLNKLYPMEKAIQNRCCDSFIA